jgi:uncharacterized membrane protein YhaH (DUF805 family)
VEKVINCLTKDYANFSGRASRSEYWYFVLFSILVAIILSFLGTVSGLKPIFSIIDFIFRLGILIPTIAVLARRLHDLDKSGWWQLIGLVPLLGGIYLLILCCTRGTEGTNSFGDDPL